MLMKCALIALLFCSVTMYADDTLDDKGRQKIIIAALTECGLIAPNQVDSLLEYKGHFYSRAGVVQALAALEYARYGIPKQRPTEMVFLRWDKSAHPVSEEQLHAIRETVEKLHNCALIDTRTVKKLQQMIADTSIAHAVQLLSQAASLAYYYENLQFAQLSPMIDEFRKSGLLTEASYERLRRDLLDESIMSYGEFPGYFSGAFQIQPLDSTADGAAIEALYRSVAARIPELAFTDFQHTLLRGETNRERIVSRNMEMPEMSDTWLDSRDDTLIVQFRSNGRIYRQRTELYGGKIASMSYDVNDIFNKVLADLHSPVRLAFLSDGYAPALSGDASSWLVPLRKDDIELIENHLFRLHPDINTYSFDGLNNETIDRTVDAYRSCGLLAHISEKEITEAQRRIAEKNITSFYDVAIEFPNVLCGYGYDDCGPPSPYKRLLNELAAITHGDFAPTHIEDGFDAAQERDADTCTLSFVVNNKKYSTLIEINRDYYHPEFLDVVVQAMSEQKLPGRLYRLEEEDYSIELVYLTPSQYEYLKKQRVLDFAKETD